METRTCSVYNHGVLLKTDIEFQIDTVRDNCLFKKRAELTLPDSDALTLEDSKGYRYIRVLCVATNHYIFKQI